jgi:aryl-alcohol dehydrogenase-like predicted oxidoreductase
MNEKQKIGLGTVQFGSHYGISNKSGKTEPEEVTRILNVASKHQIRILDTASAYGDAEKVLGMNDLRQFSVISKFMQPEDADALFLQLQNTLTDLNIENLYGYLAHRPVHLLENLYLWDELEKYREKNIIKKIGFSLNRPEELDNLLKAGIIPELVQLPYNYFDRRFEESIEILKDKNCEIHVRSAFLQGLFFKKREELSLFFDDVKLLIEKLQQNVRHLPASLLAFTMKHPLIDHVIVGVENSGQLVENLSMLEQAEPLPDLNTKLSEKILMPSNWPET